MLDKVKLALSTVWADCVDTYKRCKILCIAIGAAIIYLEWNKIKEALLVYAGKKEMAKDKKEDSALASQEESAEQQANALEQKAKQETSDDDWYKK